MAQITAQLYTVRDYTKTPNDVHETLRKIAALGYKSVQVSGFGPIDPVLLKSYLDEYSLKLVVTHNGYKDFTENMMKLIENHHLWNCEYVGLGSMPGDVFPRTEKGFIDFAREAQKWSETLAKEGLKFVYHNHNFEFVRFDGKTGLDLILENSGDELQMEMDTFWVQAGGADPAAWIKKIGKRMEILHVKDFDVDDKANRRMREIGEGNLNWPAILEAGRSTGIKNYIVEQDDCNGLDPFRCLGISLHNLEKMGLEA